MSKYEEIGQTIIGLRKAKGHSREWLALECEISVSYLRQIETGKANPTVDELPKISDVLGIEFKNPLGVTVAVRSIKMNLH